MVGSGGSERGTAGMTQLSLDNLDSRVQAAVDHFWASRSAQSKKQGGASGKKDAGRRADVTGGKQLDGFASLVRELLIDNGVPDDAIYQRKRDVYLPGYFRPTKMWDIVVVVDGKLLACVEFKSQVGSFGNNYNNRAEEAIGNAVDLKTAYREGAFAPSGQPWVGHLMLLEEAPGSTKPVEVKEPHFSVFPVFKNASYVMRYEQTLQRLLREEVYDATCLLLTTGERSRNAWREPNEEIGFRRFAGSLLGHAIGAMASM